MLQAASSPKANFVLQKFIVAMPSGRMRFVVEDRDVGGPERPSTAASIESGSARGSLV